MKKLSFFLLLLSVSIPSFSQYENFDLSTFKQPDLKINTLETEFQFNSLNYDDSYHTTTEQTDQNNKFGGNINIYFNQWVNNQNTQKETFVNLNLQSGFSKSLTDNTLEREIKNFNSNIRLRSDNRFYINPKLFFETDLHLIYFYIRSKEKENNPITTENINNHQLNIEIPLKIGVGRIDYVHDARHALYIIDELTKIGKITKTLTPEEINQLAGEISKLKSKRFFDNRIKKMKEIESLDSILQNKRYVSATDVKYFTTLYDFWEYGGNVSRLSGSRFNFFTTPGLEYKKIDEILNENNQSLTIQDYNIKNYTLRSGLEYYNEKPINLKWQNSFMVNSSFSFYNNHISNETQTYNYHNFEFYVSDFIGFYPNTRTYFGGGLTANYLKNFDQKNVQNLIITDKSNSLYLNSNLFLNYYLSPKTRLEFSSQLSLYKYNSGLDVPVYSLQTFKSNSFLNSYSLKLTYSIF